VIVAVAVVIGAAAVVAVVILAVLLLLLLMLVLVAIWLWLLLLLLLLLAIATVAAVALLAAAAAAAAALSICGGILSSSSLNSECALYGEPGSDASSLEPVLESAQLSEVATPLQEQHKEIKNKQLNNDINKAFSVFIFIERQTTLLFATPLRLARGTTRVFAAPQAAAFVAHVAHILYAL